MAAIVQTRVPGDTAMTALREPRRRWRSRTTAAAWTVSTLGLLAFGAGLVYLTAGELLRAPAPTPPEVTRDVIVRHAEDAAGRRASFRILLFTDEFRCGRIIFLRILLLSVPFSGRLEGIDVGLVRLRTIDCLNARRVLLPLVTGGAHTYAV